MTNTPPRASRPSAIRRRPQQTNQSVDEFINAGNHGDTAVPEASSSPAPSPVIPSSPTPVTNTVVHSPVPPASATVIPASHDSGVNFYQNNLSNKEGEGKAYFALFLGICALGVGLYNLYNSWLPLGQGIAQIIPSEPSKVTYEANLTPVINNENQGLAQNDKEIQGAQWLAITDLQFARHDLLLGLNDSAQKSLILAKVNLDSLGAKFADESTSLDRIIANLRETQILSLGQLDRDLENLKEIWFKVVSESYLKKNKGMFNWFSDNSKRATHQELFDELATTEEGRYLNALLDRIKWLALWGDEQGFHQASISLETFLGKKFLESSEAKTWVVWLRELQRLPLRHDVTEINALIVRLSRLELPP